MSRKIYDAVHGFIHFSEIESKLIDSVAFQRLRYIRQLGVTYLVYPGATHTRFEHSLGVMHVASHLYDQMIKKETLQASLVDYEYWRQIIRLAALCHDLGHLPFSHTAEKDLLGEEGHERWTLEIIQSDALKSIWRELQLVYPKNQVLLDIIKLSIGEEKLKHLKYPAVFSSWDKVLCQVITADFFGADRIDYLLRDSQGTGVHYGSFDYQQLIEMVRILPSLDKKKQPLELGIEENGIESCEALLLARHFMHRRVYHYSSVKAFAFHLNRFMCSCELDLSSVEQYLQYSDNEILSQLEKASIDPSHVAYGDAQSLQHRKQRFRAKELPSFVDKGVLERWIVKNKIDPQKVSWSLSKKDKRPIGMHFPLLTQEGKVVSASHFSQVSIPMYLASWIYFSPELEEHVALLLEKT